MKKQNCRSYHMLKVLKKQQTAALQCEPLDDTKLVSVCVCVCVCVYGWGLNFREGLLPSNTFQ